MDDDFLDMFPEDDDWLGWAKVCAKLASEEIRHEPDSRDDRLVTGWIGLGNLYMRIHDAEKEN